MSKKRWYFLFTGFLGLFTATGAGSQPFHSSTDSVSILSNLKCNEVLIEYTVSDSVMIINAISRAENKSIRQRLDDNFRETVCNYRRQLRLADISELAKAAWRMYTLLLSPVKKILEGKSRLIIIPGKYLLGIAFESFLTEAPEKGTCGFPCHQYLIRDFEVTYHYSVVQWAKSIPANGHFKEERGERHGIDFAGFSPVFARSSSIVPLPASGEEVSAIVSLFGKNGLSARMAAGAESGKNRFLEMASTSRVIHIASHHDPGNGRPGSGGFLFWQGESAAMNDTGQEGVLTLKDILNMRLKADLVVLNACATASVRREGQHYVATMPAGFLGAGAKNILATLWNITDKFAGRFMVNFYRKWLSGMSYSRALRETKMDMIASRDTALPTLWAAWVLIGR